MQPSQRGGRPKDVEEPFQSGRPTLLTSCDVEIVTPDGGSLRHRRSECQEVIAEIDVAPVDDRGAQPLECHGVAFDEEPHRLGKVPPIHIEHFVQGCFDHIATGPQREVVRSRADVDETAVIVAVGRRKSPGAAPALDGPGDGDTEIRSDLSETLIDLGDDGGIEFTRHRTHGRTLPGGSNVVHSGVASSRRPSRWPRPRRRMTPDWGESDVLSLLQATGKPGRGSPGTETATIVDNVELRTWIAMGSLSVTEVVPRRRVGKGIDGA
ncbi:hypothetical protein AS850_11050 [Frondihabitans sp. 762G35]|nr:hypothetical protein AS850_11050 [Frondihabitans sp. 762G35]